MFADPLQERLDLVYFLPEGVSAEGTTLILRRSDGVERTLLQMPAGAQVTATEPAPEAASESESAEEPEPTSQPEPVAVEPEPTAEPSPEQRAADFISSLLSEEAQGMTDPWTLAILEAGVQNVSLQDGGIKRGHRDSSSRKNGKGMGEFLEIGIVGQ